MTDITERTIIRGGAAALAGLVGGPVSAHLSHFRRSSGLPPQDNFDGHGATRWVAYGSL